MKITNSSEYGIFKPKDLFELKTFNLHIELIEKKYSVVITFNGYFFKVYNNLGTLLFTSPSLKQIENEMKRNYKI